MQVNDEELKSVENGKWKVESYLELDKTNQKFRHSELDSESDCEQMLNQVQHDKTTFNSPLSTFHSHKRAAFTLAEVLITLGVIGVVAVMTIPVLISKHNENVTMTKLKKFYSAISQAQLRAIAEYGDVDSWDWVSEENTNNASALAWFNKYFTPYLNKVEIIDYKKLNSENEEVDDGIHVKFADGSVMTFGGFAGGYFGVYYYTNYKTYLADTGQQGKDLFVFGFTQKTNLYGVTDKCLNRFNGYMCVMNENTLKNDTRFGCYQGSYPMYCSRLLQINGWKVPKDYPYKF